MEIRQINPSTNTTSNTTTNTGATNDQRTSQGQNQQSNIMLPSATGTGIDLNPTPSRFLLETGMYGFTPGLITAMVTSNEFNPFEQSFKAIPTSNNPLQQYQAKQVAAIEASKRDSNKHPHSNYSSDSEDDHHQNQESMGSYQNGVSPTSRKGSSELSANNGSGVHSAEERRRRFLERNRLAASKCRQRKKQKIEELEKKATEVSQRNEELKGVISNLKDELLQLKNKLLAHRNCECGLIQEYLNSGALSALMETVTSPAIPTSPAIHK